MIDKINEFVLYHPYTISVIWIFGSIAVGMIIKKLLIFISKIINNFTSFSFEKLISYTFKNIPIQYATVFGIYKAIIRMNVGDNILNIANNIFDIFNIIITLILLFRLIINYIHLKGNNTSQTRIGNISNTSILDNIIKTIACIVGIIAILGKFNISITPILTALGVGGIAVALALQDVLSNLFSGIYVISTSQIKPGDYIKIPSDNIEGTVEDISWRNTLVKSFNNEYIYIPNSKISSSIITNLSQTASGYVFTEELIVKFDEDLDKVEKVIYSVAKTLQENSEYAEHDYEPAIRFKKIEKYGIHVNTILKSNNYSDYFVLKHEFVKAIIEEFNKKGISIAYPTSDIHLK